LKVGRELLEKFTLPILGEKQFVALKWKPAVGLNKLLGKN